MLTEAGLPLALLMVTESGGGFAVDAADVTDFVGVFDLQEGFHGEFGTPLRQGILPVAVRDARPCGPGFILQADRPFRRIHRQDKTAVFGHGLVSLRGGKRLSRIRTGHRSGFPQREQAGGAAGEEEGGEKAGSAFE